MLYGRLLLSTSVMGKPDDAIVVGTVDVYVEVEADVEDVGAVEVDIEHVVGEVVGADVEIEVDFVVVDVVVDVEIEVEVVGTVDVVVC